LCPIPFATFMQITYA